MRNRLTNIAEVFKRLNDITLCSEQLNLNWNFKNNFKKPTEFYSKKNESYKAQNTFFLNFKKLEFVLMNV